MKFLEKILSGLLAASAALSAAVTGSAAAGAEEKKLELIYEPITAVDKNSNEVYYLGQNLYLMYNETTGYRSVYSISDEALKNWQSGGKLSAKKVKVDKALSGKDWYVLSNSDYRYSDYALFYYAKDEETLVRDAVKYDSGKNTLTCVYSSEELIGIAPGGIVAELSYVLEDDGEHDSVVLKYMKPDSKSYRTKTYTYDLTGANNVYWSAPVYGINYSLFEIFGTGDYYPDTSSEIVGGEIFAVDTKGKKTVIAKVDMTDPDETYKTLLAENPYRNYIAYFTVPEYDCYIYLTDTGKTYSFGNDFNLEVNNLEGREYKINSFGEKIYGTTAIAKFLSVDEEQEERYALIDIRTGKLISKVYLSLDSKDDGNSYLYLNKNGKWGYLDAKGKVLGSFSDASEFIGESKYAPVIKDGRFYFTDRSMKRVSDIIEVGENSGSLSLTENVVKLYKDGSTCLVTYKGETSAAPEAASLKAKKSGSKVTLSWDKVSGAEKYQVYCSTDGGKTFERLGNVNASKTSITTGKLETGKTYKFKLRSYNTAGGKKQYSKFSNTVTVKL